MPSPMMAVCCADPGYRAELAKSGFDTASTIVHEGKTYTHDDLAAITDESYRRQRPNFAIVCGGKPRMQRKRTRQLERACKSEVYGSFHISWFTVAAAVVMGIIGGPVALIIAVVSAVLSYYIEKDLAGEPQMMAAMGCA